MAQNTNDEQDHAKINTNNLTINCQVCNAVIMMEGKESQVVVKCSECKEATPLKGPPPGKQYVRCPCKCLLICRATAVKIGCPRKTCGRTIVLASTRDFDNQNPSTGLLSSRSSLNSNGGTFGNLTGIQISCGSCGFSFSVNPDRPQGCFTKDFLSKFANCLNNNNGGSILCTTCPHCYKISSVGPGYSRVRWVGYLLMALIIFTIAIIICTYTKKNSSGLIVVDCILFLIVIALFVKSGMFYSMPISRPEQSFENI